MALNWKTQQQTRFNTISAEIRDCLLENGSLTQYLNRKCHNNLQLELIRQSWIKPNKEEALALSIKNGQNALIREVLLKYDNQNCVYARSIFPEKSLNGKLREIKTLGKRPLGELIFSDNSTKRIDITFAIIPPSDTLHKQASHNAVIEQSLWGRRSVFQINKNPILVTEVFLPAILQCINSGN